MASNRFSQPQYPNARIVLIFQNINPSLSRAKKPCSETLNFFVIASSSRSVAIFWKELEEFTRQKFLPIKVQKVSEIADKWLINCR